MILADENIHGYIIKTLREAGFEVISVRETAKGIKDQHVIQLALQHNYLLLTEDKDFGEWVFAHHIKDLSVLFLRYSFSEYQEIARTLTSVKNSDVRPSIFCYYNDKKNQNQEIVDLISPWP